MKSIEEMLLAAIYSARVARNDVRPVSIFLCAKPERGKTSIALKAAGNTSIVVSDCSAIGILEALKVAPSATHIIITDLMTVQGHRENVSTLTIAMLNALAEEGTYKIAVPKLMHLDLGGRKVGIIACCTPDMIEDKRHWWIRSGFFSRLLILNFDHSPQLIATILENIQKDNGKRVGEKKETKMPEPRYIGFPDKLSRRIQTLSQTVAKMSDEIGYRKQKQFRALVCGRSLYLRKRQVEKSDVDWLEDNLRLIVGEREGTPVMLR